MRPEDLREFRDRNPFHPFHIFFTDGQSFGIPHRDFLYIEKHTIEIAVAADPALSVGPRRIVASPLHVIRVETAAEVA